MFKLSLASSSTSPTIERSGLQLVRGDAADAHLHALAVAEAALEHDDAAVGQRRRVGDVEAADRFQRDRAGRRSADQPAAQIAVLVGKALGEGDQSCP